MSTEQEARKARRLADEFFRILGRFSPGDRTDQSMALAARALELGADLPPEPEWKPGQVVWLRLDEAAEKTLAQRAAGGFWWPIGMEAKDDDEVLDVEPVTVLTAEDVRELLDGAGIAESPPPFILRFFRERGLDV